MTTVYSSWRISMSWYLTCYNLDSYFDRSFIRLCVHNSQDESIVLSEPPTNWYLPSSGFLLGQFYKKKNLFKIKKNLYLNSVKWIFEGDDFFTFKNQIYVCSSNVSHLVRVIYWVLLLKSKCVIAVSSQEREAIILSSRIERFIRKHIYGKENKVNRHEWTSLGIQCVN